MIYLYICGVSVGNNKYIFIANFLVLGTIIKNIKIFYVVTVRSIFKYIRDVLSTCERE